MANPFKYVRGFSFSGWQATRPTKPLPGPNVDDELSKISQSLGQTIDGLADVRRADGKLKNQIVTVDSLASDLSLGLRTPTRWTPSTIYRTLDTVFVDLEGYYGIYRCQKAHTSGASFPADLAAGRWEVIFSLLDLIDQITPAQAVPYVYELADGTSQINLSTIPGAPNITVSRFVLNGAEQVRGTDKDWYMDGATTLRLVSPIALDDLGLTSPATATVYVTPEGPLLDRFDDRFDARYAALFYPKANAQKNLRDYGGKLTSGVDDTAAIAAARAATPRWASIRVPAGPWNNNASPPAQKTIADVKLWQMEGTCFGDSAQPVLGVAGADTIETFALGSKFIARLSSYPDAGPVFRMDAKFDHVGGAEGNVINSFLVNTTIETNSPNFVWGGLFVTSSKGRGGGQHAGLVSAMKRPADALADGFGPRDQIFGNYTEVMDLPEVLDADTAGSTVGYELDLFCHGTDLLRRRQVLSINIGKPYNMGSDGEVGRGVHLNTNNPGSYYGTMFSATANFRVAALDLRAAGALNGAARHVMLPPTGKIGWVDTTNPNDPFVNTFDIEYVAGLAGFNFFGAKKMQISNDATNAVKVWSAGQLRSLTIKKFSALVADDDIFVAGA